MSTAKDPNSTEAGTLGADSTTSDAVTKVTESGGIKKHVEDIPMAAQENSQYTVRQDEQTNQLPGVSQPIHDTEEPSANVLTKLQNMHIPSDPPRPIQDPSEKELPKLPQPSSPLSGKAFLYPDPTPKTPQMSRTPSTRGSDLDAQEVVKFDNAPNVVTGVGDDGKEVTDTINAVEPESGPEIQHIMGQFMDETEADRSTGHRSPTGELHQAKLNTGEFPLRKSSLEPLRTAENLSSNTSTPNQESMRDLLSPPPVPSKRDLTSPSLQPLTPALTTSHAGPFPPPEPEPEQPFDFHRFLEQLRHKSADPVAKFLRSFLTEFGKKQWLVHEQVKIIGDFLAFITNKMALCDVWRHVSDTEFDNAKEGMEKLVMNRLYSQTFSPVIPPAPQPTHTRGKQKEQDIILIPGRRGQHQEDVERDEILAQKIRIYNWVKEQHLDIAPVSPNGQRFLRLAQQELLKIKSYRAPRDKVICVLNCSKVIFGLLKNSQSTDTSADSFVPLLIYVVLQANPEHLVSNVQYILRFRNQGKLGGEAGYYLSSLSGAIQFIESLDRTSLTITDEEFEQNVELAVSAIAEKNRQTETRISSEQQTSEKSPTVRPDSVQRRSMDPAQTSPGRKSRNDASSATDSGAEENAAVAGLLRTIQKPLSTIGRIFSEDGGLPSRSEPAPTPQQGSTPRLSPSVFQVPRNSSDDERPPEEEWARSTDVTKHLVENLDAQEAAARQASAESAEARRIQRAEHSNVVETLCGMFPNLDKEVIDDVVRAKEGRVGLAVDACLALTAGGER